MTSAELERLAARLQALPLIRAPHTLLPRVTAAVHAWSRRPWYQRAWFTWPPAGQVAALLFIGIGGAVALAEGNVLVNALESLVAIRMDGRVVSLISDAAQLATAAQVLWTVLVKPAVPYAGVFVAVMCAGCAACGVALNYVLDGRTFQS